MGFYDFWIGKLPCEMRFPPLIRGGSYIGLPHVLGLKPCGTGGFAASVSRRRGPLKLQLRGKGREDTVVEIQSDHIEQNPLIFTGFPHSEWMWMALSGRIWRQIYFLPAPSSRFFITHTFLVGAPNLFHLLITVPPTLTDVLIPL